MNEIFFAITCKVQTFIAEDISTNTVHTYTYRQNPIIQ